ncbi:hypothetical protein [Skermania piniformis]|uniref:Uncharacterized protein n=1 Tax=Skermania pinensis TaxID=39122 RepID=A0ABX8SD12_9ACTN|nr:hypothetical protein [Skermania piniformis]QXQ14869.1 hypothetical protein KV203_05660 [Skermania piniformis]
MTTHPAPAEPAPDPAAVLAAIADMRPPLSLWLDVAARRALAHAKHGARSIEHLESPDPAWLPVLVEEIGEVANSLTYDGHTTGIRDELLDVLAVASAWIDAIDRAASDGA